MLGHYFIVKTAVISLASALTRLEQYQVLETYNGTVHYLDNMSSVVNTPLECGLLCKAEEASGDYGCNGFQLDGFFGTCKLASIDNDYMLGFEEDSPTDTHRLWINKGKMHDSNQLPTGYAQFVEVMA